MNTLLFRTIAPLLTVVMLVFSIFITMRGHNEPGGGFIGGLIAASGIAVYGMASGPQAVRRALLAHPLSFAGFGVLIAALSGLLSMVYRVPLLTGLWAEFELFGIAFTVSTPMVFDIGVYFAVFGSLSGVALALEDGEDN